MGVVARQTTLTSLASYLGISLGLLNKFLLFPNLLHSSEVGLSNFILEISVLLSQFSLLGVPSIILKFFPVFENRKTGHQGFLYFNILLSTLGYLLFLIVFFIFKDPILHYFAQKSPLITEYYSYILVLVACLVYNKVLGLFLRFLFKTFVPVFISDVVIRLLNTIVIFFYAINWVSFESFVFLFTAVNGASFLILVAYLIYLKHGFFFSRITQKLKGSVRQMLWFGMLSFLNETASILVVNVSAIMLAGMVGLDEVGIYTTVLYITATIMIPGRNLIGSSAPRVAELWMKNDKERLLHLYQRVTVINSITSVGFFILIWANFENLFSFVPEKYMAGKWVLIFLGLSRLVDSLTGLNAVILVTSSKYWIDLLLNFLLLGTCIGLNYVWIPLYGISGAAAATVVSYSLVNFLRVFILIIIYNLQPFTLGFLKVIFAGTVSVGLHLILPVVHSHVIDLFIRSFVISLSFVFIIIYSNASPDLNGHLRTALVKLRLMKKSP